VLKCSDAAADATSMLRPATPEALERLRRAGHAVDRELDTALTCLGILPPLDLTPIRTCLADPSIIIIAGTNRDGHRRLEVRDRQGTVAWIDHDGDVAFVRGRHLMASA
jgi:hypothetical protein